MTRRRAAIFGAILFLGALVALLIPRHREGTGTESGDGSASDAEAPSEATLRAAPMHREHATAPAVAANPEIAARLHAEFEKSHPTRLLTGAVSGKVIDESGQAVLVGRVDYRGAGAEWKTTRIEYDGTFEFNDPGQGPYELAAQRGSGPIDRRSSLVIAGHGDTDVVLRAPHRGTLKVRLATPLKSERSAGYLTREDADRGTATSGLASVKDGDHLEFTGLEPGVSHVLWIREENTTYAYLQGVKPQESELIVAPTEMFSMAGMVRSDVEVSFLNLTLTGAGIAMGLGGESVRSANMANRRTPVDQVDDTLRGSTFGTRIRPTLVPSIAFHFAATGQHLVIDPSTLRIDREKSVRLAASTTVKPGESISAEWKEIR